MAYTSSYATEIKDWTYALGWTEPKSNFTANTGQLSSQALGILVSNAGKSCA